MMVVSHSYFGDEICNQEIYPSNVVISWYKTPKFYWEEGGIEYIFFEEKIFLKNINILLEHANQNYSTFNKVFGSLIAWYIPFVHNVLDLPVTFSLSNVNKFFPGISLIFGEQQQHIAFRRNDYEKEMEKIFSRFPRYFDLELGDLNNN